MNFLHSEIGSAKDNFNSPVHNWYKFTAGFSYKFVDEIISLETLNGQDDKIFDPFAGCGTTLVSAQKAGIIAIGNEAQDFMYDVIRAKLNWKIEENKIEDYLKRIRAHISSHEIEYDLNSNCHPLLLTLYKPSTLKIISLIKDYISCLRSVKYRLFLKLALSQTLHKVSIHPIAVPYIVRNKTLNSNESPWDVFTMIVKKMLQDSKVLYKKTPTSKIYLQDSRIPNKEIKANSCTVCITSPPYLNNLDYGEISKVHTHFFGITESWNDITQRVRKKLVTGATTHYLESEFTLAKFKRSSFYKQNTNVGVQLTSLYNQIKIVSATRSGKKSFHILMMLYFQDMHKVLVEIRRVLKPGAKAYLILGDSAPYGNFIPTTKLLGKIALNTGFQEYKIIKIRSRGTKWKSLTYRHSVELTENVLVLK
jgi:DNA modification methylase